MDIKQISKVLAVEMTARTGELWRSRHKVGRYWSEIYSPSAWLMLSDGRNNRLEIQSTRPQQMVWATTGEKITVDSSRTPEAIARDIENRLLKNARHVWSASRTETKIYNNKKNNTLATVHLFRKYISSKNINGTSADLHTKTARIRINENKVSDLDIRYITNEQAIQIMKILEG